jgi:hypothetical protein
MLHEIIGEHHPAAPLSTLRLNRTPLHNLAGDVWWMSSVDKIWLRRAAGCLGAAAHFPANCPRARYRR